MKSSEKTLDFKTVSSILLIVPDAVNSTVGWTESYGCQIREIKISYIARLHKGRFRGNKILGGGSEIILPPTPKLNKGYNYGQKRTSKYCHRRKISD